MKWQCGVMMAAMAGLAACRGNGDGGTSGPGGVRRLSDAELATWKLEGAGAARFRVLGGFELNGGFAGDLAQYDAAVGIELLAPDDVTGERSVLLMRPVSVKTSAVEATRLQTVAVGIYEPYTRVLTVAGEALNDALDASQRVARGDGTQVGTYVVVEGIGAPATLISGSVTATRRDVTAPIAVERAVVIAGASPFVAVTGLSGKFVLPLAHGATDTLFAIKDDLPTTIGQPGIPAAASTGVAFAGDPVGEDGMSFALQGGAPMVQGAALRFVQSAAWQPDALPPTVEPAPVPTADTPSDRIANDLTMRAGLGSEWFINVDLGCSGFRPLGGGRFEATPLVRDGSTFDDYPNYRGWRAAGDVEQRYEHADEIFGAPETLPAGYLDGVLGYCLLTTGTRLFLAAGAGPAAIQYRPGPGGEERTSEMWQKLRVPKEAASIQIRVAFYSQEAPERIAAPFSDRFSMRFDESLDVIAQGNLHDIGDVGAWLQPPAAWAVPGALGLATGPRLVCKDLTGAQKDKVMTLRFTVSDVGGNRGDTAMAVDAVVFGRRGCADTAARMSGDPLLMP